MAKLAGCLTLCLVVLALTGGAAQAAGGVYVALGDSYMSAPLVPNQRGDPIDCGRSDHNYPSLVAAAFGFGTFVDVSCGSAETKHMTEQQTGLIVATTASQDAPELPADCRPQRVRCAHPPLPPGIHVAEDVLGAGEIAPVAIDPSESGQGDQGVRMLGALCSGPRVEDGPELRFCRVETPEHPIERGAVVSSRQRQLVVVAVEPAELLACLAGQGRPGEHGHLPEAPQRTFEARLATVDEQLRHGPVAGDAAALEVPGDVQAGGDLARGEHCA